MPIKVSIDYTKISKERLAKGKYLNIILIDKPDTYGNDGFVAEDQTKEEREAGQRGKIIGNFKHLGGGKSQGQPAQPRTQRSEYTPTQDDSSIPF